CARPDASLWWSQWRSGRSCGVRFPYSGRLPNEAGGRGGSNPALQGGGGHQPGFPRAMPSVEPFPKRRNGTPPMPGLLTRGTPRASSSDESGHFGGAFRGPTVYDSGSAAGRGAVSMKDRKEGFANDALSLPAVRGGNSARAEIWRRDRLRLLPQAR